MPPAKELLRDLAEAVRCGLGSAVTRSLLNEIARADPAEGHMSTAGLILGRRRHDAHPADGVVLALTGSVSTGSLAPMLTAELARHGLRARLLLPESGDYRQDLRAANGDADDVEFTLCVIDADVVFDALPAPWTADDVAQAAAAALAELRSLAALRTGGGQVLVLNTVLPQRRHVHQVTDLRARALTAAVLHEFNAGLLRLGAELTGVIVIDLVPLVVEGGPAADSRLAQYAGAKLGDEVLARYAREVGHIVKAHRGGTRKVLVLDLDNTLWDGVLGDDGPTGIAAAGTLRGEAFRQFQHRVHQLAAQGVVLAVCSKNDEESVLNTLRSHPDLVLTERDFAVIKANWAPKDENLAAIAAQLDVGLDSLVFVDDSTFEIGLVSRNLPPVATVLVDGDPATHVDRLLADGWFDSPGGSGEDWARGAWYRQDRAREELHAAAGSLADYLAELGITVHLDPVGERDVARVAQLTQRTNQFNLTTQRLHETEVRERARRRGELMLAVRAEDRFGDAGLVGAVFARWADDSVEVDNIVLSCRVFGRGIEHAVGVALLEHARGAGATSVRAFYQPTARNARFADFYAELGFTRLAEPDGAPTFVHDLAAVPAPVPHIRLRSSLEGSHNVH